VDTLEAALEGGRRAGKRQAAPFSKGELKSDPKKPVSSRGRSTAGPSGGRSPTRVDETLAAPLPCRCPACRGEGVEDRVEKQVQTEIPRVEPLVRAFDVHVGHWVACGKRVQGRYRQQTSDALGAAASQLEPRVVAFSAWQDQVLGLPSGKASDLLLEAFGIEVTRGGLSRRTRGWPAGARRPGAGARSRALYTCFAPRRRASRAGERSPNVMAGD
jgi:transposase